MALIEVDLSQADYNALEELARKEDECVEVFVRMLIRKRLEQYAD